MCLPGQLSAHKQQTKIHINLSIRTMRSHIGSRSALVVSGRLHQCTLFLTDKQGCVTGSKIRPVAPGCLLLFHSNRHQRTTQCLSTTLQSLLNANPGRDSSLKAFAYQADLRTVYICQWAYCLYSVYNVCLLFP